jgi:hypothetical protein
MCEIDEYAVIRENLLLACGSASVARVAHGRDELLGLPRGWLLSRIEAAAEPMLEGGDPRVWRRMLELYRILEPSLLAGLARRAAEHPGPEVANAGRDFLVDSDPR